MTRLTSKRSREQFIPIRRARLVQLLADNSSLSSEERASFVTWCQQVATTIHSEYHAKLEAIKDDYDSFNPDAATTGELERSLQEREHAATRLFTNLASILNGANYHRLSREEIEATAEAASDWGVHLNVDFTVFKQLEVFARGDVLAARTIRRWKTGYRREAVEVPIYERLVVVFQLHEHKRLDGTVDTRAIYLKLFKNIPKQDIDMLLPCGNFQMSWLDHGKVIVPTMSGFLMAVAKGFTAAIGALFHGFWGVIAFLGFVGGTAGYGVKSFLGYLRTKDKYQLNLTRHLYYQNLDNNAGVMFRILDEAEEQECREVILAYELLRREANQDGWSESELDTAAEAFLQGILGFQVDFEVADALDKLKRLRYATVDAQKMWRAVPLDSAIATHFDTGGRSLP
ncbi:MAG: DUF3754 domain-containing protein [Planctomycetaceae bacterium]|nr:DUF3754 domain-containing protein [Planctomycetales bacterium]MCB9923949.1 DUF3754 domain-containing protein [Planctomycetaceae bacterium]